MSFTDQTLYCRDCGQEFVFTAGEQEFYQSRGLTNSPTRCPSCRSARKAQMGGRSGGNSYGGNSYSGGSRDRGERQMYSATCASCGKEAMVPFQPREDRPVYCSDCFQSSNPRSGGNNRRSSSRW
ncbi:zinc-ribbon domain containing protein [Tengunoibacter tsumagoiensis]|uniref:Zinc-binding protein n=1 Tax=Tengunoibacter tsumagoiensis TaxID=2014871 RepID=A0A401ZU91_9CHLR|nr:zinc-ribbon domain containing protein [Tengunoibacter tsumagoiensis]GCE10469.1 zinc-binding protein [Tengunoibacter tsumagoiensis]